MVTFRKPPGRIAPSLDVPLLTDVVENLGTDTAPLVPEPIIAPAPAALDEAALNAMLTERIAALADRLLQDVAEEFETKLINRVREQLRQEIPALVAVALRENRKE